MNPQDNLSVWNIVLMAALQWSRSDDVWKTSFKTMFKILCVAAFASLSCLRKSSNKTNLQSSGIGFDLQFAEHFVKSMLLLVYKFIVRSDFVNAFNTALITYLQYWHKLHFVWHGAHTLFFPWTQFPAKCLLRKQIVANLVLFCGTIFRIYYKSQAEPLMNIS